MVTGVAISPLMGVGAVGAYHYYKTSPDKRRSLQWFAQPWFWVPALVLVAFVALKDVAGTAAPTALKKPFDVAEAIENKISGLIAVGAFVPLVISIFPDAPGTGSGLIPGADINGYAFAAVSGSSVGNALLTPLAMLAFAFVWLASHAINMLIILSPFTIVDSALKSFRLAILGLLTGASFASPYLGAAIGVAIIIVSYFIAGWSFRLTTFGTAYIWDYVTFRRCRFQPGTESNWMFTARRVGKAPVRTLGKLVRLANGKLRFDYRPWLFLKRRSFDVPQAHYAVGRGLFCPEIDRVDEANLTAVFVLPPRYLTHEESLSRAYGFDGVRDVGLLKGMKAMWKWLKGLAAPRQEQPAPTPVAVT
jgi:hypothetical protein